MKLQQVFEATRGRLQQEFSRGEVTDLLEHCSEVHWCSDDHKVTASEVLASGWELARKHSPEAELFEARLVAAHYEGAVDTFVVAGLDEADAVRRFQEKLSEVLSEESPGFVL